MPYATRIAMAERFSERELVELTDRVEPYTGAIVDAVLARAMEAADAEIDAALRDRYEVPLMPVPALIVDLACDLARWRLWDDQAPEAVSERAKVARAQLRDLAAGRLKLAVTAAPSAGLRVVFDGPGEIFTPDRLRGL